MKSRYLHPKYWPTWLGIGILRVFEPLPHTFEFTPSVFKQYPTRRAAYEALFVVWASIPLHDRE